jgi:hypothetical protein
MSSGELKDDSVVSKMEITESDFIAMTAWTGLYSCQW